MQDVECITGMDETAFESAQFAKLIPVLSRDCMVTPTNNLLLHSYVYQCTVHCDRYSVGIRLPGSSHHRKRSSTGACVKRAGVNEGSVVAESWNRSGRSIQL